MAPSSPHDPTIRPPHPLALRAIERLAASSRVLDFGTGSGRNAAALRAAGFDVVALDDATASRLPPQRSALAFSAAIATHALLHGTADSIAPRLRWLFDALAPDGHLFAAFGSVRDARFGGGRRIDARTYAPVNGDETGVAHAYYSSEEIRGLLEQRFSVESLEEVAVDEIAGRWAHQTTPLRGAVHWFTVVRKPSPT